MLHLEHITKQFENHLVLDDVSLTVEAGEIVCLLGSSGCGKTTLLRCVGGLETPDTGTIRYQNEVINDIPANQRGFGLMFQDYALFPHLNVAENIAFGLENQSLSRAQINAQVQQILQLVDLAGFDKRSVNSLSGGEQQRVALARSLAPQPRLLMLDEPLGSLDAALREHLVMELRQILKTAGVTALYVTHDQQEAFAIADRIAVMHLGRIEQIDEPRTLYLRPTSVYVAEFLGLHNIVPVQAVDENIYADEGLLALKTPVGNVPLGRPAKRLLLHPAHLELMASDDSTISMIVAIVEQQIFKGSTVQLYLRHLKDGFRLKMYLPINAPKIPKIGDYVRVRYNPDAIIPLP